ncbi:hypothetical protein HDU98_005689, partial [Podochytrium sp. JEL0797]
MLEANLAWLDQESHGHYRNRDGLIDFAASWTILQAGERISTLRTSLMDSERRKYLIQASHRLLPTQQVMHQRKPLLYKNGF